MVVDAAPEYSTDNTTESGNMGNAEVDIAALADERIQCAIRTTTSGILWTTDAYYPGWKVTMDGKEARLLRVNYFFRGVSVPSGTHHVEFYYECRPMRFGFLLVVVALLIMLLGFAIGFGARYARLSASSTANTPCP